MTAEAHSSNAKPNSVIMAEARFESARARYEAFRESHREVFQEHDQLAVAMNEALEALKVSLRDNAVKLPKSVGDFKISIPRVVDADLLYKRLGEDAMPVLNVKYSVVRQSYEKAVQRGDIPPEVVREVEGFGTPRITGPHTVTIYSR